MAEWTAERLAALLRRMPVTQTAGTLDGMYVECVVCHGIWDLNKTEDGEERVFIAHAPGCELAAFLREMGELDG